MTGTDLAERLLAQLAAPQRAVLDQVVALAHTAGYGAALVGGSVRDLLLSTPTVDLDLVVLGDAIAVAQLAQQSGTISDLRQHDTFGTATLYYPNGLSVDLITARREVYPLPGALPVITPGSFTDDLRRRDFTLNTLAITFWPNATPQLVDELGGMADLTARTLRILHPESFLDDPTRILRGLRYAGRLGLQAAPDTAQALRAALTAGALRTVTLPRLAHELVRMLAEDQMPAVWEVASHYDLWAYLPVPLPWSAALAMAIERLTARWTGAAAQVTPYALWEARLALLLADTDAADTVAALQLPATARRLVSQVGQVYQLVGRQSLPTAASALGQLLDPFAPAAIIVVAARCTDASTVAALDYYLQTVRLLMPALSGAALVQLGLPPGPIYRQVLQDLLAYKRDHPAVTVAEEQAFVEAWWRSAR